MPVDLARLRECLLAHDFQKLFTQQLGWDHHRTRLEVAVDGRTFPFDPVAEKRGVQVLQYVAPDGSSFPDSALRGKIEHQVTRLAREHILIFTDAGKTRQLWQWVRRRPGQPIARKEYRIDRGQSGEALAQRIQHLAVSLDEEEIITLVDVTGRTGAALDVDRVTKRFYERFKTEHSAFLKFIDGIPDDGDCAWYASLMLNRLMFIYFIQKKRFLDRDPDYLRHRLEAVKKQKGKDKFHSFYRYFLVRLFHEGLGLPPAKRNPDLEALLGKVPYLNGGLFDPHELEDKYPKIDVPDKAFERLFAFFDDYNWHLDDRPLANDREINPDVLGYIFEKYINQKQMGAYYTKEDITGYIARNTIIPFLFDAAEKQCTVAFEPGSAMWRLLRDDPDKYIYPALGHGITCDIREKPLKLLAEPVPLPAEIAKGVKDVAKRDGWNRAAPDELALPTETWREHVARRQRCEELRAKLRAGEVHSINDLVTYNLDICQFAQDAIEQCEGPELLRAFWKALESVSVLDPTCGSGAFLFAALNILQPLYDACLDRMEAFIEDLERATRKRPADAYADFREVLADMARHRNRRYFVLKSIIVRNLYGVDIMDEAVEICKLRLFLKLVAQLEPTETPEPLPDIDFNIRAGNTLVGFASLQEVRDTMKGEIPDFVEKEITAILESVKATDVAFQLYRKLQTEFGADKVDFSDKKQTLQRNLRKLHDLLDRYLAGQYEGVDPEKPKVYAKWRESHKPFHWFAEFYGVMSQGGFDLIIGNPPYVEYRLVRNSYRIMPDHFRCESTGNLYAFCMERSGNLAKSAGRFGMIVPSSLLGLEEVKPLRELLLGRYKKNWFSTYSIRPSKLFDGVDQRLCIHLAGQATQGEEPIHTTRYHHWNAEERDTLFDRLGYHASFVYQPLNRIPQLGSLQAHNIIRELDAMHDSPLQSWYSPGRSGFLLHYHRSPRYWIRGMDFEPHFKSPTRRRSVHHIRDLYFKSAREGKAAGAIINSSLFFFWFLAVCNGRNLAGIDVEQFPVGRPGSTFWKSIAALFDRLMKSYQAHSIVRVRQDCELQEFRPSCSKEILDAIDRLLAEQFQFGEEERDFIINFEIKYRMGQKEGGDEEE